MVLRAPGSGPGGDDCAGEAAGGSDGRSGGRAERRGGEARVGQAPAGACGDDCAGEAAGGCVWRAVALGVGTAGARRAAGEGGGQRPRQLCTAWGGGRGNGGRGGWF